jgi:glycosyltransferase involved in cell wall biosynthesis
MKILYITFENLSLHKGSVVHVRETVNGLQKLGHRIGLIARSRKNFDGCDHFYNLHPGGLKRQPSYIISSVFLFFYLLKLLPDYDVVYVREFYSVIIALFPRLFFRRKLVFEMNGIAHEEQRLKGHSLFNRISASAIQKVENMAARCSDRIVSVTPQIASYLIQKYSCQRDKIEIVGNGVNGKRFYPIQDKTLLSEWRRRWGIDPEDTVILFVGNLALWQGVDILVEAAARLLPGNDRLKFLIVGDGVLKTSLIKKVSETRLEKAFIFTGMVDHNEIPFFINIADICVAPFISARNRKTGLSPLKVYEYMACGKPVISSRIWSLEWIEEEGAGCLVEPGDVISLEKALLELQKEPRKRIVMGRKGLQIVREKFDWESGAKKIEKIIEELV